MGMGRWMVALAGLSGNAPTVGHRQARSWHPAPTNTCLLPVCDPAIPTLHPHMYLKLNGSLHLAPQTGTVIALLSSVNPITICALSRNPPHVSSNELEIDFGK